MLRLQRSPVHRVGEQHLFAGRLGDGEAALVEVHVVVLDAAVGAGEDDLGALGAQAGLMQERGERCARPLGRADRLAHPGLADRAGRHEGASVAGAFHRDRHRDGRPGLDLAEREVDFALDQAADAQTVGCGVDVRDVEVDEEVVHAGRRDRVAEALERHPAVAQGERDLFSREVVGALYPAAVADGAKAAVVWLRHIGAMLGQREEGFKEARLSAVGYASSGITR